MTTDQHSGMVVDISREALGAIADSAFNSLPDESCGVLVGRIGYRTEIVAAWNTANHAHDNKARRFVVGAEDVYRQTVRARGMALEIIGFFHSHPTGEANPSQLDIRNASPWPGYLHAIYACTASHANQRLRLYRTHPQTWNQLSIRTIN